MTDLCEVTIIWNWYKAQRRLWEVCPKSAYLTKELRKAYAEFEIYEAQYWGERKP